MKVLSVGDLDLKNKKVLLRVDFNVPLDGQKIVDDTRIRAALPTIHYILEQGGSIILMSHLGRPNGQWVKEESLEPIAKALSLLLKKEVQMAKDVVGQNAMEMAKNLKPGQIMLLENLRFEPAETKPSHDPSFCAKLASMGDLYVNDAFATAHRKESSTYTICQYFKECSAAGYLMEKEILYLKKSLDDPKRPFYAMIGGAKVSSKLNLLQTLFKKVDALFIGGAMAYTFLKAQNIAIGSSPFEPELIQEAKKLIRLSEEKKIPLYLPLDLVVIPRGEKNAYQKKVIDSLSGIPEGFEGVDIGPKTVAFYNTQLKNAKTIFWNGPFGLYEIEAFAKGTIALLDALPTSSATIVIGGGDLVAACHKSVNCKQFSHISTGGGATLEFIEKGELPAISALTQKKVQKNFS